MSMSDIQPMITLPQLLTIFALMGGIVGVYVRLNTKLEVEVAKREALADNVLLVSESISKLVDKMEAGFAQIHSDLKMVDSRVMQLTVDIEKLKASNQALRKTIKDGE